MDVATEYGIFLSLDQELRTLLYFISSARQKRLKRQQENQLSAAAANQLGR